MKTCILTMLTIAIGGMLLFFATVLVFDLPPPQGPAFLEATAAFEVRERATAIQEVKDTTESCRLLLGWTEGTIIHERDMVAFALCMHPTLKKHHLLNN